MGKGDSPRLNKRGLSAVLLPIFVQLSCQSARNQLIKKR